MRLIVRFEETKELPIVFQGHEDIECRFSDTIGDFPKYSGSYTVTPTTSVQVLDTQGLLMTSDVTINPIPNNYGLITYNGFEITVS